MKNERNKYRILNLLLLIILAVVGSITLSKLFLEIRKTQSKNLQLQTLPEIELVGVEEQGDEIRQLDFPKIETLTEKKEMTTDENPFIEFNFNPTQKIPVFCCD